MASLQENIELLKKKRKESTGRPKPPRHSDPRPRPPAKRKSSGAASLPLRRSGESDEEYDEEARGGRVVTDEMKRELAHAMENNTDSTRLMKAIDIIKECQPDLMRVSKQIARMSSNC
jgi:hypothetical protein